MRELATDKCKLCKVWDWYHLSIRLSYSIFKGCHYQAIMNEVAVLVVFIKDYNNATNVRVTCIYIKKYMYQTKSIQISEYWFIIKFKMNIFSLKSRQRSTRTYVRWVIPSVWCLTSCVVTKPSTSSINPPTALWCPSKYSR